MGWSGGGGSGIGGRVIVVVIVVAAAAAAAECCSCEVVMCGGGVGLIEVVVVNWVAWWWEWYWWWSNGSNDSGGGSGGGGVFVIVVKVVEMAWMFGGGGCDLGLWRLGGFSWSLSMAAGGGGGGRQRSNHGIKNDKEELEKQTVASVHFCFYVTFSCDKLWVGELSGYEVKAVEEDVMVVKPNGKISVTLAKFNKLPGTCQLVGFTRMSFDGQVNNGAMYFGATSYKVTSQVTISGFKEVQEEEKSQMVGNVFSSVASNYDLMNDVMSGGLHRLWKDRLISKLNPFPGMRHLDVAGGTGDVAFRILESLNSVSYRPVQDVLQDNLQEETQIYVCDINTNMLNVGKIRAQKRGLEDLRSLRWVKGDAEALCFEDASMDGYTIAFGIRNVTHIEKVLAEAYSVDKLGIRVLKPGGRFLCLELSHVEAPGFKQLYDYYSFCVIPALGELIAGDRESYQYLVESIRRFPPQDMFASMIADAGFQKVEYENLVGGVVAIHSGLKF
ncbi:hypothetical protein RHMOL_Rhmol08G0133100 [Rhododendron molle]|uniref:Uncharacterized protein n=3 Tax=Rhododendron molle TaxID=49168 RepID=A0ACC0MN55_RHOML|nr:hypothetical protein RHMOL_Rhmol08G0133100 [Rhododendron molle]KAI8542366.1 hypothetical protein RHMOL_Rhmol08G0133100 [Rhododendron molle]KAI8542367.1 hypothetical protein RHMOL_Rhmol08G0133100 [Rhododendron molle]